MLNNQGTACNYESFVDPRPCFHFWVFVVFVFVVLLFTDLHSRVILIPKNNHSLLVFATVKKKIYKERKKKEVYTQHCF